MIFQRHFYPIPCSIYEYSCSSVRHVTSRDVRDQSRVGYVTWCTSPAKNTITYPHHSVTSSSRRQDSSVAGPCRSSSAFWRYKTISTNIYGGSQVFYFEDLSPKFGRGPGPVMVTAIVSHGLPALRPLYNSQEGIAITVESSNFKLLRCFD